jgi:hypothetical protein
MSPSNMAQPQFCPRLLVLLTPVRAHRSRDSKIMLIGNDIIGTTLVLIASNAFSKYKSLTGAVQDRNTGLLRITSAQFAKLETLTFTISGVCIL